jgi:MoxR-like ATPase
VNPQQLVQSWLAGRAYLGDDGTVRFRQGTGPRKAARFRRAYDWIAANAVYAPYHDVSFDTPLLVGRGEQRIDLPRSTSYASFILLPILTLLTSRRMVFVGAPGRGKTTMATLMALLAGASLEEVRQAVQHGHPQLTIADLLGSPLPSELIRAEQARDIRVSWRHWITARVKIIDEYNRIPTKTQSALLSLMAEGYAEMYEQVIRTGKSAWYLTANDDQGGGTFPVIEALKDRIDVVVRCTPFHAHFLDRLEERVSGHHGPEEFVPADLVCTRDELDSADEEIRAIPVPEPVRDVLGFLLTQLEFCRRASDRLEYRNKDTLHLAGRKVAHVCTEDCPLDKNENLCAQTENGVSARSVQTLLHYAKALAWFRGHDAVALEDIRALLPWVMHDKLQANPQSSFFQKAENAVYVVDRVSWIRQLFDKAVTQHAAYATVRKPTLELQQALAGAALSALPQPELKQRMMQVQKRMEEVISRQEMNGATHADLVLLKDLFVRCQNEQQRRADS